MNVNLHRNARTTPAIRRELQTSTKSDRELAREYHLNRGTVCKWRRREGTADASHRPHRIHATLSPVQEQIVVALRQTVLLPLDDLLAVTREFIHPEVSRSGLNRCLRRHGVSNLRALIPQPQGEAKPVKTFKDYAPGFVHVDVNYLPRMPDEAAHQYLFVAIDRASRWVYVEVLSEKTAAQARALLNRLVDQAPFTMEKILTDNGKEFTDRFCASGERQPTGRHPFDQGCIQHRIDHRLITPGHPQTSGRVERFNGRISEVLADTLTRYVRLYNHQIPQKALGHIAPVQALKEWQHKDPKRFKKRIHNLTGFNSPKTPHVLDDHEKY